MNCSGGGLGLKLRCGGGSLARFCWIFFFFFDELKEGSCMCSLTPVYLNPGTHGVGPLIKVGATTTRTPSL